MNLLAVLALVLAVPAWLSMVVVLKWPALRRTMWPVWFLQVLSLGLAVASVLTMGTPMLSVSTLFAMAAVGSFLLFLITYVAILRIPPARGRPEAGQTLPEFSVVLEDGRSVSVREIIGHHPAMIVFFRGFWCLSCTDELRNLAPVRDALRKKGGDILAISADKLEILKMGRQRMPELPCKLACDPGAASVMSLHLLQENMAKVGKKVAIPATLLVDAEGIVRWTHYAGIVMDRPDPRFVLRKVIELV